MEWPIVGKTLIYAFREHHRDQTAICRHDFMETNGANFMVAVGPIQVLLLYPFSSESLLALFIICFLTSMFFFASWTSQIHSWAHASERSRIVSWLQKSRIILSPEHHASHHSYPFTKGYCITNGWLNGFLNRIAFFRGLEFLIESLTPARAREDDLRQFQHGGE